jgi:hypothetical protein
VINVDKPKPEYIGFNETTAPNNAIAAAAISATTDSVFVKLAAYCICAQVAHPPPGP